VRAGRTPKQREKKKQDQQWLKRSSASRSGKHRRTRRKQARSKKSRSQTGAAPRDHNIQGRDNDPLNRRNRPRVISKDRQIGLFSDGRRTGASAKTGFLKALRMALLPHTSERAPVPKRPPELLPEERILALFLSPARTISVSATQRGFPDQGIPPSSPFPHLSLLLRHGDSHVSCDVYYSVNAKSHPPETDLSALLAVSPQSFSPRISFILSSLYVSAFQVHSPAEGSSRRSLAPTWTLLSPPCPSQIFPLP